MRGYFDELSRKKRFRGIQEVLVKEINNTDSRSMRSWTTTDSFYRYKEAVKELIDRNLRENELRRQELEQRRGEEPEGTPAAARAERAVELCTEAMDLLYQIEREFDVLERRYNQLIEQKTVFAGRAGGAYPLPSAGGGAGGRPDGPAGQPSGPWETERRTAGGTGGAYEGHVVLPGDYGEELLQPERQGERGVFAGAVAEAPQAEKEELGEFVLRPLYTERNFGIFWNRSQKDGVFRAGKDTVRSMEDLEKLFFIWQEMTEQSEGRQKIEIGEEVETEEGFRFSS